MYLSVTQEIMGSILVREEDNEQSLNYYANGVLKRPELNYAPLEKLAFIMIMATTKLRPYLKAHTIEVRINYPLHKVLHKSKLSRWLSTWSIMLSAYDIKYVPRKAMKAQALADLMVEMTLVLKVSKPLEERLQVWTNGVSNIEGARINIVL